MSNLLNLTKQRGTVKHLLSKDAGLIIINWSFCLLVNHVIMMELLALCTRGSLCCIGSL